MNITFSPLVHLMNRADDKQKMYQLAHAYTRARMGENFSTIAEELDVPVEGIMVMVSVLTSTEFAQFLRNLPVAFFQESVDLLDPEKSGIRWLDTTSAAMCYSVGRMAGHSPETAKRHTECEIPQQMDIKQ